MKYLRQEIYVIPNGRYHVDSISYVSERFQGKMNINIINNYRHLKRNIYAELFWRYRMNHGSRENDNRKKYSWGFIIIK